MSTVRIGRRALVAAGGTLLVPGLAWGGDAADALLARIATARAGMKTLRGPFVQTRTIGLLATDVRSSGILTLVSPDRLRWELLPPDAITFWIAPEGLAYRDAHGQARMPAASAKIAGALDDLRTMLGGDPSRLRDRWELRSLRDDATGAVIEATPRPPTSMPVSSLRFELAPDLVRPTRATLTFGPRDRTLIDFGALVVDGPVDSGSMVPPRG